MNVMARGQVVRKPPIMLASVHSVAADITVHLLALISDTEWLEYLFKAEWSIMSP